MVPGMGGNRPSRTPADLEFGFDGTDYGMRQLLWTGVLLSEPASFHWAPHGVISEPIEPWIRNALIESFLNNARRLAWFLHGAHDKDAYAGDYLRSWHSRPDVGPIIGRVSESLSHARYKGKPGPYQFRSIVDPIADGMLDFVSDLGAAGSVWHGRFKPLDDLIGAVRASIHDIS